MNTNIFSECLSNCRGLNLSSVYLRYFGIEGIPHLTTIYELIHPIDIALSSINENISELRTNNLGPGAVKGLFTLGVSNLEVMLGDVLKTYLSFFPQKLTLLKSETGTVKEKGEFKLSKDQLQTNGIIEVLIDKEVEKVLYYNIIAILEIFCRLLPIDIEIKNNESSAKLVEVKETRNLLLHNNLVVNHQYLKKTKDFHRESELGKKLLITSKYAFDSLCLIQSLVEKIRDQILDKYGKYSLLALFRRLWDYTFKSHIKFEDHFYIDEEKDIYSGPFKESKYSLASSELFYLQVWTAQRWGSGIDNFALCHLSDEKKLTFLVEVFGTLRLTST